MLRSNWISSIGILLFASLAAKAKWFTSIDHMKHLIRNEAKLLMALNRHLETEYINLQRADSDGELTYERSAARLQELKNLTSLYAFLQQLSIVANSDVDKHLAHPVNQLHVIYRFVSQWKPLVRSGALFAKERVSAKSFPDRGDVDGASRALIRLQEYYKLNTRSLAAGNVAGHVASYPLTKEQCFVIGKVARSDGDYKTCALWMREAWVKMKENASAPAAGFAEEFRLSQESLMRHLLNCSAEAGDRKGAIKWSKKLVEMYPTLEKYRANLRYHLRKRDATPDTGQQKPETATWTGDEDVSHLKTICRRAIADSVVARSSDALTCRYWTNNGHPRLILSPVKVEELWRSPQIVRIYDVIGDAAIREIEAAAVPRLGRNRVIDDQGEATVSGQRVSKGAWLGDGDGAAIARLSRRVEDVTGLMTASPDTSERFHVVSYGMGGHYEPHFDHLPGHLHEHRRNRMSTFLLYLSDVPVGGHTVFLGAGGVAVPPVRASALFWHNLLPSGDFDRRTMHAACPLLVGEKLIANKWIHENGNEFARKCPLSPHDDYRMC